MRYNIKLNGIDITKYVVYPLTFEFVLDNALDQAYMEMRVTPRKTPYKPFSLVEVKIDENATSDNTETIRFYVSSDEVEVNMKTGKATHKILLIEETKILERYICSAKSFVNPLYRDYDKHAAYPFESNLGSTIDRNYIWVLEDDIVTLTDNSIYNIYKTTTVTIPALISEPGSNPTYPVIYKFRDEYKQNSYDIREIRVIDDENKNVIAIYKDDATMTTNDLTLQTNHSYVISAALSGDLPGIAQGVYSVNVDYNFGVIGDSAPKNNLNITSVVNQLLEVAEPIRKSETPRFSFNSDDAEMYKDTPCAELNFANGATLRENLEAVAALVHAIPRLKNNVVYFEKLGGTDEIDMTRLYTPVSYKSNQNTEKFASHLDSVVNGLMNMENINTGALTDPFPAGYRTLRSEVSNIDMRTKYDTAMIDSVCSIEKPTKVIFRCGGRDTEYDITPYIYEKKEYDLLATGRAAYPFSKSYALYYIQGQPGIYGLNYKEDDAISSVFKSPAIENIVKAASGDPNMKFDYESEWANCLFRVTYITTISGRVRQTKRNVSDITTISAVAYNQTENRVSSVNFGNRLKGEIAMYGNYDVVVCHKTKDWQTVRNAAGKLYTDSVSGNKMYINQVRTKIWRDYMLVEFTLSRNFNQIGKYVGINSQMRQFEIDTNTQERFIVYEDYCIIGKNTGTGNLQPDFKTLDYTVPYTGGYKMTFPKTVSNTIIQNNEGIHEVQLVKVATYDENETEIDSFLLPVQSVALGNSIIFNFRFEDNYSAGKYLTETETNYKLTREARYGDYIYGEATYMKVEFWNNVELLKSRADLVEIGDRLPLSDAIRANIIGISTDANAAAEITFSTGDGQYTNFDPIIIHKSSRDMINFTYQIHFVTNDGFILGSALAQENELIGEQDGHTYHEGVPPSVDVYMLVYFLNEPINEITGITVNFSNDTRIISSAKLSSSISANGEATISLRDGETAPSEYTSWAIIDSAGHFILGKNGAFEPFSIYTRHKFEQEED